MDIEYKLREILMPILGIQNIDEIEPEKSLVKDLGAESIDFVEILYMIETQFGVKIKIQEIAMTDYSTQEENLDSGKITAEIAAKLNTDFNTTRFKEGQTVKYLFESFTVKDLSTIIEKRVNQIKYSIMRFYLVDRIDEISLGKYVVGRKCVSMSDDIYNEHFPGYPIFPGSLILEGLAQMTGLFFEYMIIQQGLSQKRAALTMINKMKYRRIVTPGDFLIYRADVKMFYPDEYAVATVSAKCEGKLCAQGELFFGFLDIMDAEMKQSAQRLMEKAFKETNIITE